MKIVSVVFAISVLSSISKEVDQKFEDIIVSFEAKDEAGWSIIKNLCDKVQQKHNGRDLGFRGVRFLNEDISSREISFNWVEGSFFEAIEVLAAGAGLDHQWANGFLYLCDYSVSARAITLDEKLKKGISLSGKFEKRDVIRAFAAKGVDLSEESVEILNEELIIIEANKIRMRALDCLFFLLEVSPERS